MNSGRDYKYKYGGQNRWEKSLKNEIIMETFREEGSRRNLYEHLLRLDGKHYGAYGSISGKWDVEEFVIMIDKVQIDPFAPPSHVRASLDMNIARFPDCCLTSRIRNIAACDYVTRRLYDEISLRRDGSNFVKKHNYNSSRGNEIRIEKPSQNVLRRSCLIMNSKIIQCRCTVSLPARGRRIEGEKAAMLLCDIFIDLLRKCMYFTNLDLSSFNYHVDSVEDQEFLRNNLENLGLVGFVINGAVLPRLSGADDRPLEDNVVSFTSPKSLECNIVLPNCGTVTGMGIRKGITLIVGGGFNGKTTLLEALQFGIYNKVPGDGREFVVVINSAVKIRAEDGRPVTSVDISPFIRNLPYGKSTRNFSTMDASGSTSQSANIMECLELKSKLLIVDEDTCATNFMIRDRRMQELVVNEKEPITPFVSKIRPLFEEYNVSTILVVGGCGDFFDAADTVVHMDAYCAVDVTEKAKKIALKYGNAYNETGFGKITHRVIDPCTFNSGSSKIKTIGTRSISFCTQEIDLSCIEQIVEPSQTHCIAHILLKIQDESIAKNDRTMYEMMMMIKSILEEESQKSNEGISLDKFSPYNHPTGFYSCPRIFEIAGAINRLRSLKVSRMA